MNLALLSPDMAGQTLGVSPETLKGWRRRGVGPKFVRAGRLVRYAPEDLAEWKREQTIDPGRRTA